MNRINLSSVRTVRPAATRLVALLLLATFAIVGSPGWSAGPAAPGGVVVNINRASAEELQALPGVGEARAAAIVALRKERGAFRSVDELLEVRGIGPAMLERMRSQVALSGETRLQGAAPATKSGR
jgi:competence protein ComEA